MRLREDIAPFFTDFADEARYNDKRFVPVIADREFLFQLGMLDGRAPAALVQVAQMSDEPVGKTLAFGPDAPGAFAGMTFVIRSFEPLDDGAVAVVRLEAQ